MKKQIIVAISREFGSGGHEIAAKIAEDLGLSLYDRNMLDTIAKEQNLEAGYLEKYEEKPKTIIISRHVRGYSNSLEEHVASVQFDFIKKKADSGESFVVVGRCADEVLRGREGLLSIFILGDKETKAERVMKKYNLPDEEAITKMNRHDKKRKAYHNSHSKYKWGDSRNYDICINSGVLGIDETANTLECYIKAFQNSN